MQICSLQIRLVEVNAITFDGRQIGAFEIDVTELESAQICAGRARRLVGICRAPLVPVFGTFLENFDMQGAGGRLAWNRGKVFVFLRGAVPDPRLAADAAEEMFDGFTQSSCPPFVTQMISSETPSWKGCRNATISTFSP